MGAERSQEAWKPFSPSMMVLRKTTRQHENLQQLKNQISNQLHAQTSGHNVNEMVKNQLLEVIELLERKISKKYLGLAYFRLLFWLQKRMAFFFSRMNDN